MRRLTVLAALAMLVTAVACSDDDNAAFDGGPDTGDAIGDAGGDGGGDMATDSDAADVIDEPDAVDLGSDAVDVAVDVVSDADVDPGTGTIGGNIFNNTGTTDGSLTVALVESLPVQGEPALSVRFESPSAPIQSYEFTDVPVGFGYYVVAHWDVGDDDSIDDPGDEDLLGQTQDPVQIHNDGESYDNINVEVF